LGIATPPRNTSKTNNRSINLLEPIPDAKLSPAELINTNFRSTSHVHLGFESPREQIATSRIDSRFLVMVMPINAGALIKPISATDKAVKQWCAIEAQCLNHQTIPQSKEINRESGAGP
jgi:hypothetical protein